MGTAGSQYWYCLWKQNFRKTLKACSSCLPSLNTSLFLLQQYLKSSLIEPGHSSLLQEMTAGPSPSPASPAQALPPQPSLGPHSPHSPATLYVLDCSWPPFWSCLTDILPVIPPGSKDAQGMGRICRDQAGPEENHT